MELKNRKHVYIISLILLVFLESYFCRKISSGELPSSLEDRQEISTNKDVNPSFEHRKGKQMMLPLYAWPYSLPLFHRFSDTASLPSFLPVPYQYYPAFYAVFPAYNGILADEEAENSLSHAIEGSSSGLVSETPKIIPCKTRDNEVGICKPFTECFPMMEVQYGSADYIDFMDVPLAEQLVVNTNDSLCSQSENVVENLKVCCPPHNLKSTDEFLNIRKDERGFNQFDRNEKINPPVITQRPPLRNLVSKRLKDEQKCGKSVILQGTGVPDRSKEKVTGGQQATGPKEFPHMVAVFGKNNKIFCGASLISDQFLLSAAHCFSTFRPIDIPHLYVHLGDFNIKSTADGPHEVRKIDKVIVHKGFNINNYHNDIALIKLDKPVNFTERISPICLPDATTDSLEKRKIIVTGWGRKYRYGTTVDILRKVEMPVWSLQECKNLYSRFAPGRVMDNNLCAGDGRRDKDACLGDSGGPAIMSDGNKYVLVGITSWGKGCGSFPGVYTRITSKFIMWITKNLHQFG